MNKGFTLRVMAAAVAGTMVTAITSNTRAAVPTVVPAPAVKPVVAASATQASAPQSAPHIKFDNTVYDFGNVHPTDVVKHEFVFTNTGNATLELTMVRPSCGCTTAGEWTKLVEPGKTGVIPIQFNPGSYSGNVAKSVTVQCNDPSQGTSYLQIKGSVWRPIEVQPRYAYFTVMEGSETNQTKVVRIISNEDQPITVSQPEWDSSAFKAELKTVKPGKEFEVHISLVPPVSSSRSVTPIRVKTSSTNIPVVTISAYAMVQPSLQVMPQRIVMPYGPVGNHNQYHVMVRNNGTKPLELSDPSVNAEGVNVSVRETQKGRLFDVQLSFPGGFEIAPGKSVLLSIKSNSTSLPTIRVPIIQLTATTPVTRPTIVPRPTATAVRH